MTDKLPLSDLIVADASDASIKFAISRRKARLNSLRASAGMSYGRTALIQLLAEAVVVQKVWHHVVSTYLLGGKPKPGIGKSVSYLSLQRADLLSEYSNSFEPYFDNEPGFMDMDLSSLRQVSRAAANGDKSAEQQIDFFYCYYSTVVGMCYGYNKLVLERVDPDIAKDRVAVSPQSVFTQLAAVTSYTEYFTSALMQPEYQGVGRFTRMFLA